MKNIVNETEKVHDETLQLMLKAQELMNEKMMHYEQIKAHIENDGDKIVNSEENFTMNNNSNIPWRNAITIVEKRRTLCLKSTKLFSLK